MKKLQKFYTYIFSLFLIFGILTNAYSREKTKITLDSMAISQEVIDAYALSGSEALTKLMEQNAINDKNGESFKNNYIFNLDGSPPLPDISTATFTKNYSTGMYDGSDLGNFDDLNIHLRALNLALMNATGGGKSLIYIGIDTKLGFTIRKEAIKTVDSEATYTDFDNATLNIKGISFTDVKNAYNTIFTKIAAYNSVTNLTSSYNQGIQIIGLGVHANFTMKDLSAEVVDISAELKKKTNGRLWVISNFIGSGTPAAISWANDNTVRQTVYNGISKYPQEFSYDGIKGHLTILSESIKQTLIGDKIFESDGFLYDDCYGPTGGYKSNLDADVTDDQVKRVNALIKEMMDNTLYASYIKVSLDTKTVGGGKIKQIDLINMEKALISLKSACQTTYNQTSAAYLTKLISFLTQCSSFVYEPCEVTTYVPRCFWDSPASLPPGVSVADIPVCAGIIDGAIETVWGVLQLGGLFQKLQFDLATEAACMIPGATLLTDGCIEKREKFKSYFDVLSDIPKAWDNVVNISSQISSKLGSEYKAWLGEITSLDNCGRYRQGRALFDVASLFVGAGEFKLATKGFSVMQTLEKFAQKATQTVGKITIQGTKAALKNVTVTLANKSRTAAMAVIWGAATTLPNTYMHILPKATVAMEWASSKISSLARPIAEASTNMGDEMVGRVLIGETSLEASAASEIASATNRVVFNRAEVGTLETVKDLANATQRPAKTIALGAGESIESSVITTVSGTEYIAVEVVNNSSAVRKLIAASVLVGSVFTKLKPKDEEPTESKCTICSQRLTNSPADKALCTKLEALAARGRLGVDKLCRNIPIGSNTVLENVVDKLSPLTEAPVFLSIIAPTTSDADYIAYNSNVGQITPAFIDAWKLEADALGNTTNKYLKDWETINTIKNMMTTEAPKVNDWFSKILASDDAKDRETQAAKGGTISDKVKVIASRYSTVPCKTCGDMDSNIMPTLENSWYNVKYFLALYNSKPSILNDTRYFGGYALLGSIRTFLQGHHFQLSHMREEGYLSPAIEGMDKRFSILLNPVSETKQYDLKFTSTDGFIEYKSVNEDDLIVNKLNNRTWGDFDQFIGYLREPGVTSMGTNLKYFFRKKNGSTVTQSEDNIKTAFQKLFCTNCDDPAATTKTLSPQGLKAFDAIWGNTGFRNILWNPTLSIPETQARLQFTNWVSILDSRIFNFIKSR